MFDPLIKLIIKWLDAAVDWYLEHQRIAIEFVIPGTLLFVVLFFVFSGAGGASFILFLTLAILEGILACGLFLLQQKYQARVRQAHDIADAIEASLFKCDVFEEWETFLKTPLEEPRLERIRQSCRRLPDEYPPEEPKAYCGPKGDRILEQYVEELRAGIAARFIEDVAAWRAARRAGKRHQKVAAEAPPEPTMPHHMPATGPASILDDRDRQQVEREASTDEARRAAKAARRAAQKTQRTARKEARRARKQASREGPDGDPFAALDPLEKQPTPDEGGMHG